MFLDPPYDSEFSDYAGMSFTSDDQVRLANYLYNTKAKFMLVIKKTRSLLEGCILKKRFQYIGF